MNTKKLTVVIVFWLFSFKAVIVLSMDEQSLVRLGNQLNTLTSQLEQLEKSLDVVSVSKDATLDNRTAYWTKLGKVAGFKVIYDRKQDFFHFENSEWGLPIFTAERTPSISFQELSFLATSSFEVDSKNPLFKIAAENYKIHLMPKDDQIEMVLERLINTLKSNPDLSKLTSKFKVYKNFAETDMQAKENKNIVIPRIVIYPASRKENVQKALNIIYDLFFGVDGLDIYPRFNAKVTSLIYVAQGDGNYKENSFLECLYEQPKKIYYNPNIIPPLEGEDHYLRYPNTPQPLID